MNSRLEPLAPLLEQFLKLESGFFEETLKRNDIVVEKKNEEILKFLNQVYRINKILNEKTILDSKFIEKLANAVSTLCENSVTKELVNTNFKDRLKHMIYFTFHNSSSLEAPSPLKKIIVEEEIEEEKKSFVERHLGATMITATVLIAAIPNIIIGLTAPQLAVIAMSTVLTIALPPAAAILFLTAATLVAAYVATIAIIGIWYCWSQRVKQDRDMLISEGEYFQKESPPTQPLDQDIEILAPNFESRKIPRTVSFFGTEEPEPLVSTRTRRKSVGDTPTDLTDVTDSKKLLR